MAEKPVVPRRKCGEIFILPGDSFLLICDFCADGFLSLDILRAHLIEHFPNSPVHIKNEVYVSDSESNPSEPDDVQENLYDILRDDAGIHEPPTVESVCLPERCDSLKRDKILTTVGSDDINGENLLNRQKDVLSYRCEICSKTFTQRSNLFRHKQDVHAKNRKFQCSACEKGFFRKYALICHIREKHLSDSDPRRYFPCTQCDEKFTHTYQLFRHNLHIHKKCVKYTCDYCQREFPWRRNILTHMQLHTGIKKFKCQHCNKAYALAQSKWRHERTCASK